MSELPHDSRLEVARQSAPRRVWERERGLSDSLDCLVTEEPLEIRLCGTPVAVVMRTPGDDVELGVGFAVTERLVEDVGELERVAHCTTGESADNVLLLTLRPGIERDWAKLQRRSYASSSCGICGKQSIEAAMREAPAVDAKWTLSAATLAELPARLRKHQPVFAQTGGLHAAALFGEGGDPLVVREDVGRHNAVDKCVGWALWRRELDPTNRGVPACDNVRGLAISGRVSYEVVQKALAARIPLVAGVGAVSSLAVALARRAGMTLVGFTSSERLCVYAGEERVT